MNIYIDNNSELTRISINVHPRKIIICANNVNYLFEHLEYEKAISFIEEKFTNKNIDYIKEFLKINLELVGVKAIFKNKSNNNKNTNQYSLF